LILFAGRRFPYPQSIQDDGKDMDTAERIYNID